MKRLVESTAAFLVLATALVAGFLLGERFGDRMAPENRGFQLGYRVGYVKASRDLIYDGQADLAAVEAATARVLAETTAADEIVR